jgi:hypothetical protein
MMLELLESLFKNKLKKENGMAILIGFISNKLLSYIFFYYYLFFKENKEIPSEMI